MYCAYFVLPTEIVFDDKTGKPSKATRNDMLHSVWVLLHTYAFNTLLLSFLCHTDYLPFGATKAGRLDETATFLDYFDPRHLGNCYFLARELILTCAFFAIVVVLMHLQ